MTNALLSMSLTFVLGQNNTMPFVDVEILLDWIGQSTLITFFYPLCSCFEDIDSCDTEQKQEDFLNQRFGNA